MERLIPEGTKNSGKMTMAEVKNGYEALGGKFIEYADPGLRPRLAFLPSTSVWEIVPMTARR